MGDASKGRFFIDPETQSTTKPIDPETQSTTKPIDPDLRGMIDGGCRIVVDPCHAGGRRRRSADWSGFIIVRLDQRVDLDPPGVPESEVLCRMFRIRPKPRGESGDPRPEDDPGREREEHFGEGDERRHERPRRKPPHDEPPHRGEPPPPYEPSAPPPAGPPFYGEPPERCHRKLRCLIELLEQTTCCRLIQYLGVDQILALEQAATASEFPPLNSLAAYWRCDARHLPGRKVARLVRLLNEMPEVDLAYRELTATDPQEPFAGLQGYFEPAPTGIGAGWVAGPRGSGVRLIDLEQGWILDHEDLQIAAPIYGDNRHDNSRRRLAAGRGVKADSYRGNHGTAVLGQIVAKPGNDRGVAGLAPDVDAADVVSHYHGPASTRQFPDTNGHVADGVVAAIVELAIAAGARAALRAGTTPALEPADLTPDGDVLLIEVQRDLAPTEVDHADFDALRLASALGVVVIEAAGNGHLDLDRYRDETGRLILRRGHPDFRDSGATMTGAARAELPHDRASFSNFGARVDCWAWGEGVVSAGYGDLDDGGGDETRSYTDTFSGTSSAAPIIAGAALIVQGLYRGPAPPAGASTTAAGLSLPPAEMRRVLADRRDGTRQGPNVAGAIGVMPDLQRVLRRLGLYADVYLRVDEGDDGSSSSRVTSSTPDIRFVATAGSAGTTGPVLVNTVTLRNRGSMAAQTTVRLFRSELATLVTPGMWTEIGRGSEDVASGNAPATVLLSSLPVASGGGPPLILPATGVVGCYLALVDFGQQPSPALPPASLPYFRWRDFLRFNRENERRNVVENTNPADVPPFLVVGAPDRGRTFDFEIVQQLPGGVRATLWLPHALAGRLRVGPLRSARLVATSSGSSVAAGSVGLGLPSRPRLFLPRVPLGRDASHRCVFTLEPSTPLPRGHSIIVRQLFEGEEIGRVTFLF